MTPTNTILSALRKCPVIVCGGTLIYDDGFCAWGWQYPDGDPPDGCTDATATAHMIAAWVGRICDEQIIVAPPTPDDPNWTLHYGDAELIGEGPTLLEALAAAVCAVMPEPEDKR